MYLLRDNRLEFVKMENVSVMPNQRNLLVEVEEISNLRDIKKAFSIVKV